MGCKWLKMKGKVEWAIWKGFERARGAYSSEAKLSLGPDFTLGFAVSSSLCAMIVACNRPDTTI